MSTHAILKNTFVAIAVLCAPVKARSEITHMSLRQAVIKKVISLSAVSTGGYKDKSTMLGMTNNTTKQVTIDVDPGMTFEPQDTSYQDLVLLGGETLVLAPSSHTDTMLQTFCGKSYAASPAPRVNYHFKKQADSNLAKTLKFIRQHNVPPTLAQHAVWLFTNGHSLRNVYDFFDPHLSEELISYIAAIKKMPIPGYFTELKLQNKAGKQVIAFGEERPFAIMHWNADADYRNMHLLIFREDGTFYREIEGDQVSDKYGTTIRVEFNAHKDPKGKYTVMLRDNSNKIWQQKTVEVGRGIYD